MVMLSGDKTYHYHALSHHNKGRPMNQQALDETLLTGRACYWSRSRSCLWRKGETSGCVQQVHDIR
ncbi:phosphoribosyl-AMP cyclohydrolase, partial [Klebsiella pneumoniae]